MPEANRGRNVLCTSADASSLIFGQILLVRLQLEASLKVVELHGPAHFFGSNTSYETVAELMSFEPRTGHIIDLHRRPDGNLKTRIMLTRPESL